MPPTSQSDHRPRISPVALWIVFCAYCNCIGWILSGLHELNAGGYAAAFGLAFVGLMVWKVKTNALFFESRDLAKLRTRFRRPFPLAFFIVAAMAFLGGVLHAPNNYDGLAYREPRVLHWLADSRWHWIHADFARLNVRAVGFEWLSAPWFALTKTDRLVFLINIASFLLLPGLIFSVFHRLGVRRRVAWCWAWIAPTGYCFLLQAGGIENDMFGAVFALAAVDFALRAKESGCVRDFWLSILSAALLTGAKTSNLPLLLPWLIALLPSLKLVTRRPIALVIVCIAAALSSFAPMAVANWKQSGDWSGQGLELQTMKTDPLFRVPVNTVLLLHQNFSPPIFPMAEWWNRFVLTHIPPALKAKLEKNFEATGVHLPIGEIETEEAAPLGFGVSALLLASLVAGLKNHVKRGSRVSPQQWAILGSTWICLLVIMSKFGLTGIGRIIAPYYLLLIPAFLVPTAQERIVRAKWWRRCAAGVFFLAALLVFISQARPLWPANFILDRLDAQNSSSSKLRRIGRVFATYAQRADAFAPVRARLPEGLSLLGIISVDDPETSLWRPFGSRRIEHVTPDDSLDYLRERGIQYVLVNSAVLPEPIVDWTQEMRGEIVWKMTLQLKTSLPPMDWYLVHVNSAPSSSKPLTPVSRPDTGI